MPSEKNNVERAWRVRPERAQPGKVELDIDHEEMMVAMVLRSMKALLFVVSSRVFDKSV